MARFTPVLVVAPLLLATSAPAVQPAARLDSALAQARAEQASAEEVASNPRARSVRLRAAERIRPGPLPATS